MHDWPTDEGSYLDGYTKSIAALEMSDVMLQTMGIFRVAVYDYSYDVSLIIYMLAYTGLARCSSEEFV